MDSQGKSDTSTSRSIPPFEMNRGSYAGTTATQSGPGVAPGDRDPAGSRHPGTIEGRFRRARPAFERDFAARVGGPTGPGQGPRTFAQAEPNYRAGFIAGHDLRYEGHSFEQVEPDLRREYESSIGHEHPWEQLRDAISVGFQAARTDRD